MITRRTLIQSAGASALALPAFSGDSAATQGLPNICLEIGGGSLAAGTLDDAGIRRVKQLGVDYVVMSGPRLPWDEAEIKARIEKLKSGGLTLFNMMINGFPKTLYGQPGRDEEIENITQSIRVAGRAGLPVIEYNFYAHRAVEGYYEQTGRGGAGLTAFDYTRVKDLPPLESEGAHSLGEMWKTSLTF